MSLAYNNLVVDVQDMSTLDQLFKFKKENESMDYTCENSIRIEDKEEEDPLSLNEV